MLGWSEQIPGAKKQISRTVKVGFVSLQELVAEVRVMVLAFLEDKKALEALFACADEFMERVFQSSVCGCAGGASTMYFA